MKISLFGYGKTTQAIAKNLVDKFGPFDIYDDHFQEESEDEWGNRLLNPKKFDEKLSELEIPSPGFPPNHTLIKKAKNLQSEYDFFYDAMPKSIWISGTNGKTTTTQMATHLLSHVGAVMGANVGFPLAELDLNAKIWILETSSFTLHYTHTAKPEIYALLPISADHLSWHGNFENYAKDKLSVLERMNECDIAILPEIYAKTPTKAYIISYKDEFDLAQKMDIDIKKISFKSPFLLDAVMALSIEKILLDTLSYELLNHFVMEKNKLEELQDNQGRLWVNDTKATNENAVMAALKRYKDKKIHLIIGGDDKGVDLSTLFDFMKDFNIELYAIGVSTQKMLDYALKANLKAHKCEFLENAVQEISKTLKNNEVALLSPACASLDQFSSYAQRGEKFKEYVSKI
ncbi:TPA: UDP-N-acetylmuramoyl-L-alanine--D-glutamate ligase [Campylobacter coli]|nr:UDP-N-acetylmuramoyl-L-alanine--D-glutamate ligase [Campylobacter coli]ELK4665878.1 UDP-N-acetylmuramoyl-L-alanine--D-glutamate ligase [Campylobacter coli]HEA8163803.1 UDP-N-acetylmuramoyl-L-alanine--D-glutamate ligase [Campylobacter coli]HED6631292.1 UDP-N-acetylmuramoyl-L-alanine--D-glutamate ligase [Campylobacter coli]HED6850928.1 UDP-N-acetylmuramoyl-L-alanine--D-glutamate ligase [Campylobacter coli]